MKPVFQLKLLVVLILGTLTTIEGLPANRPVQVQFVFVEWNSTNFDKGNTDSESWFPIPLASTRFNAYYTPVYSVEYNKPDVTTTTKSESDHEPSLSASKHVSISSPVSASLHTKKTINASVIFSNSPPPTSLPSGNAENVLATTTTAASITTLKNTMNNTTTTGENNINKDLPQQQGTANQSPEASDGLLPHSLPKLQAVTMKVETNQEQDNSTQSPMHNEETKNVSTYQFNEHKATPNQQASVAVVAVPREENPSFFHQFDLSQGFGVPKEISVSSSTWKRLFGDRLKRKRIQSSSSSTSSSSSASALSLSLGGRRLEKFWLPLNISESFTYDTWPHLQATLIFEPSPQSIQNIEKAELSFVVQEPKPGENVTYILKGNYQIINSKTKKNPIQHNTTLIGAQALSQDQVNNNLVFSVTNFIQNIVGDFARIEKIRLSFFIHRQFDFKKLNDSMILSESSIDLPYFKVYYSGD